VFPLQAKTSANMSAGITISADGLALAVSDHKQKTPSLEHAQSYPFSSEYVTQLATLSKKHLIALYISPSSELPLLMVNIS
jgi:hypothetical protein